MPRRVIVEEKDCEICQYNFPASVTEIFIAGYITGIRTVSEGDSANVSLCSAHEIAVSKAIRLYIGNGLKRAQAGGSGHY